MLIHEAIATLEKCGLKVIETPNHHLIGGTTLEMVETDIFQIDNQFRIEPVKQEWHGYLLTGQLPPITLKVSSELGEVVEAVCNYFSSLVNTENNPDLVLSNLPKFSNLT